MLPVNWGQSDDLPTLYANNLVVSHAGGSEFVLLFGEARLPALFGITNEKPPKSVHIKPVARIVMTPETMIKFSEVINENLKRYLSHKDNETSQTDDTSDTGN